MAKEEKARARATTTASAMCAVATATSHETAHRPKDPTARRPALTSATAATAEDTGSWSVLQPTLHSNVTTKAKALVGMAEKEKDLAARVGTAAKVMAAKAKEAEAKVGTRAKVKAQVCKNSASSTCGVAGIKGKDSGTMATAEIGAESDR